MNKPAKIEVPSGLDLLRQPFAANHISKLPKETRAQIDARKDRENGRRVMVFNCPECGGHHHKDAVHLDYVGHAALTDRLLDADIEWSWEPYAHDEQGLPLMSHGGLWIKLTVCGVTRPGFGSADGKSGGDAIKEIIGDAMRNAAMRFGAALDLWHKGDLHTEMADEGHSQGDQGAVSPPAKQPAHSALKSKVREFVHDMEGCGDWETWVGLREDGATKKLLAEVQEKLPAWWETGEGLPDEFIPLRRRIEILEANLAEQKAQLATA